MIHIVSSSSSSSYRGRSRIDGNRIRCHRWSCKCRSRTSCCSSCSASSTWYIFALSFPCKGAECTRSRQWRQTPPGQRRRPCSLVMSSGRGMISSDLQTEFTKSPGGEEEFHAGTLKQTAQQHKQTWYEWDDLQYSWNCGQSKKLVQMKKHSKVPETHLSSSSLLPYWYDYWHLIKESQLAKINAHAGWMG